MKVETKVGNVTLSEGMVTHKFRVKINRQSFKLLYGDLYSDPISAFIRELSTNAHDSHIKAKNDSPFEIHLPNELEPWFSVKDFGTGLSHNQVCGEDGIYITFCESDKVHSDDFTGCLGLGSKSPLAYTDNFVVQSNYNGTQYSYAVHMDEEGNPSLAELGSVPTDEPNGMKIELPIQEKDFDTIRGKVADVLSWFKVKPNIVGDGTFEFDKREYLRKTDRYGICKERGQSHVVMGNVAYPISASDFSYNKIDDIERAVLEYGVDLFVDVGDVEFVPSREKLRYTDKTIVGVKKFLKDAIKSIREELESQVQSQPSVWAARRMMHDVKHSILGKVRSLGTVMYHGKEIAEYVNIHNTMKKVHPALDRTMAGYPKLEILSKKKENYRRHDEDVLHCDTTKIYLNDMQHGGYARVNRDLRENGYNKSAYMLSNVSAEFLEETGIGEVAIKASTLPAPERVKREVVDSNGVRTYVKRTVLQQYRGEGGNYMTDWWHDVEVDPRAGGIYVVCSYGQIIDGEQKTLPSEIRQKYQAVKALRPDFRLMGIRPAHMGRIEKYKSRWMKFDDYAELVLKTEFPLAVDKINLLRQHDNVDNKERYHNFINEVFEEYSVFGQFIAKLREAKAVAEDLKTKAVLSLNDCVKIPMPLDGVASELCDLENKLDEAYPILQYIDWYRCRRGSEFAQHLAEVLRGLDDRNFKASLQPIKEAV
jgi:hypothetical protein